jgi:hypothetical protein
MGRVAAGAAAGVLLEVRRCGALSVPRKNLGLPLVAACTSALAVRFALEHRQAVVGGRTPPVKMALRL